MASSAMEFQIRVFGFCRPHTRKQTQTKHISNFRAQCGISRVTIFMLQPQWIQGAYAPDESGLFWSQEKSKYPNWSPMLGEKWYQLLNLQTKSVVRAHSSQTPALHYPATQCQWIAKNYSNNWWSFHTRKLSECVNTRLLLDAACDFHTLPATRH